MLEIVVNFISFSYKIHYNFQNLKYKPNVNFSFSSHTLHMYIYGNIEFDFFRRKKFSDTIIEKLKTHILCPVMFFRKLCPS